MLTQSDIDTDTRILLQRIRMTAVRPEKHERRDELAIWAKLADDLCGIPSVGIHNHGPGRVALWKRLRSGDTDDRSEVHITAGDTWGFIFDMQEGDSIVVGRLDSAPCRVTFSERDFVQDFDVGGEAAVLSCGGATASADMGVDTYLGARSDHA